MGSRRMRRGRPARAGRPLEQPRRLRSVPALRRAPARARRASRAGGRAGLRARRSASWRSGESSAFASTSRARTNPSCRSAERSISRRTRYSEVALGASQPILEALGRVGRVLAARERDDLDVEALRRRELHPAQRRVLPGRVRVEAEVELLRQPPELAQLLLGQRRPHRGDDRLEAGLPQRDHVGVALDDRREVLLCDRGSARWSP